MKTQSLNLILAALFAVVLPSASFAGAKVIGNGGDSFKIRSLILKKERPRLEAQLNEVFFGRKLATLKGFLNWTAKNTTGQQSAVANEIFKVMNSKGLGSEVTNLKFQLSESCVDSDGIEHSATTPLNVRFAPVCINRDRLINEFGPYIQDSDLVALVFHEISHHFGFADEDHQFAAAVAQIWQERAEDESFDGPLNFLISKK